MANEELLQALLMISLYFLSFPFRFLDGWWRRNFHYPSTQGKIIISLLAMTRLKWEIYFKPFSASPMKPGLVTIYVFYSINSFFPVLHRGQNNARSLGYCFYPVPLHKKSWFWHFTFCQGIKQVTKKQYKFLKCTGMYSLVSKERLSLETHVENCINIGIFSKFMKENLQKARYSFNETQT